jgi:hypothetical protein
MANLLNENGELIASVERNKGRVLIGLIGGPSSQNDTGYVDRWFGLGDLRWLIHHLQEAEEGTNWYRNRIHIQRNGKPSKRQRR